MDKPIEVTDADQELVDLISDALDNSMGPEWNTRLGARYVADALSDAGLVSLLAEITALQAKVEKAAKRAFKEAYELGFLEGYECEPRHVEDVDDEGVPIALLQCEGTSEAWSDYAANWLAEKPGEGE